MADDKKTFCSYCDSQHTQLDYALHRMSNAHVKKVQRSLVHRGFKSACLVCNFALKDLKQAELHVQEKAHTDRMKSFLVDSYICNDKCTCGSCGITFFNEVVLEAHRLSPSHSSTTSALHTPKLDELSRLLSGLYGKQFMSFCNRLCSVCDVTFTFIEDSIMHLFTAAHISRVRSSSCIVCKKDFNHASDRELHINSSKHQIALRKCSNVLVEGRIQALLSKGGYPCMFCMIWCNSWFCLELHLLDKHHAKMSAQTKAKFPISARIVFSDAVEGIGQCASCDESTMSSWRDWREDPSGEHVWCHRCGVSLSSLDELNKHLNMHAVDRCSTTSRPHLSRVFDSGSVSEIFDCSICAVSFKNAFMLSVHEASFEHHSRWAGSRSTKSVQCCSNCGILMYNEGDGKGSTACKDIRGSLPQAARADMIRNCLGLLQHHSSACDLVRKTGNKMDLDTTIVQATSLADTLPVGCAEKGFTDHVEANSFLVTDKRDNSLKVAMALGPGELPLSLSDKAVRDVQGVYRVLTENSLLMNARYCTCTGHCDNANNQLGGFGHFLNTRIGCMPINNLADGKGIVAALKSGTAVASNSTANENCIEPDKAHSLGMGRLLSEVSLPNAGRSSPLFHGHLQLASASLDDSIMEQSPVLLAGDVSDGNGTKLTVKGKYSDVGVPIVVAATFAPLGRLQESLRSMTTAVTESLSAALSTVSTQQSTTLLKRKSQSGVDEETVDQPDVKKICLERILEAALRQGLQSVCSKATESKGVNVNCQWLADEEKVSHWKGNDKDVGEPQAVVAMAASIVPNDLQDSVRPVGVKVQVEANKAQGSSAMQSGDDSNKRAQESTEVKSESLSQVVVVGGQGSAESTRGKTIMEERPIQLDVSPVQPSSVPLCTCTQNVTASAPVISMKNEDSLPWKMPTVSPEVVASDVSEESKSNDDDDYYTFLDPTKGHVKWWSSSDSEDSDSVSK